MTVADEELFERALAVRENAYAPYSNYRVGAAILDDKGDVHIGCNVENAAYPIGACAEASAIGAMISKGGRTIKKIAIVGGGDKIKACSPCGGCRQAISEFADENTVILLKDETGAVSRYRAPEMLPLAFRLDPRR